MSNYEGCTKTSSGFYVGQEGPVKTANPIPTPKSPAPDVLRCASMELVVTDLAASRRFYVDVLDLVVTEEDEKALTRGPGVGPKLARKIIVELSGRLAPTGEQVPAPEEPAAPETPEAAWQADVVQAMTGLGWSEKEALKAVEATVAARPELDEARDVAALLRATLRDVGTAGTVRGGR